MNTEPTDRAELERLLVKHLPSLQAYVRLKAGARVLGKESVSDLVQSACREVLADAPRFELRGENEFRGWLFQHALHKIFNKDRDLRAARRDVRREVADAGGGEDEVEVLSLVYDRIASPSRMASARERVERFEGALAKLPEDYREAVMLRHLLGLEYAEIAQRLERSEGATRNLVHRGLARLAEELGEEG
jgi:RNA polymerase sigma-70 factor (ECF subfamily)